MRLVLLLAFGSFVILVFNPFSYFASPERMDAYFGGEIAAGSWTWPATRTWSWEAEPFRYRVLFHGMVDGLAHGLGLVLPRDLLTYWLALIAVILASICFAFVMLDRFAATLGADQAERRFLIKLFVLMPPVHNAFVMPVQSKEEFLAYGILFAGLTALLQERWRAVMIWTVLGALTRETLLLLPGVFLVASAAPLGLRLGTLAAGLAIFVGLRLALGVESNFLFRPENFDSLTLVVISLVAIFGAFWLPVLRSAFSGLARPHAVADAPARRIDMLWRVFPLALAAVLLAHVLAARLFEIRISFILVPWVIIALVPHVPQLRRAIYGPLGAAVLGAIALGVGAVEISGAGAWIADLEQRLIGPFGTLVWRIEFVLQAGLALLVGLCLRR